MITTSGDPTHWSRKIRDSALTSPLWTVVEIPGPLAWIDRAQLDEQRRMLSDSAFARLHLNRWAASEDRLVTPELLAEAAVLDGSQGPLSGVTYAIGVDIGLRHDRTAVAVAHAEPIGEPSVLEPRRLRVILDHLVVLAGTKEHEVDLGQVEELVRVFVAGLQQGAGAARSMAGNRARAAVEASGRVDRGVVVHPAKRRPGWRRHCLRCFGIGCCGSQTIQCSAWDHRLVRSRAA